MNEEFFELNGTDLWGDYGHILIHGMSRHLGRDQGLIQLERTGPFVPPISFPGLGDIVVTHALQKRLEQSGLTGFRFQSLIKQRIVDFEWREWDWAAREPQEMPDSGEPEDYILSRPHSQRIAQMMAPLNELVIDKQVDIYRTDGIRISRDTWSGEDFFRANGVLRNYVSTRAREWLEEEVREWVRFKGQAMM